MVMPRWTQEEYERHMGLKKAVAKAAKKPGPTKAAMIKEGVAKGEFLVSTLKRKEP